MRFMEELLHYIESNNIPAPAPIEQRWSRTSSSLMSPSHSNHPQGLHTWVGYVRFNLFFFNIYPSVSKLTLSHSYYDYYFVYPC